MKNKFNVSIYQRYKKDPINAFQTNTLLYSLFPNDNAVSSSIIEGWQYEFYMFDFIQKNMIETQGKTIVDVGANLGSFSIDFAYLVGDKGKVYSFEPQRLIYYQLCGNIFMNGLDNVHCHNVAVGDSNDPLFIETPDYHDKKTVNFGNVKISDEGDIVNQKRLDDFEFEDLVIIKIDVQGYEEHVIDGAINTIAKHRPYLFVEFEEDMLKIMGSSEEFLTTKIESLGYVVKRFQEGISYQTTSGKCLDCVCIPKEKFEEFNHIIP